MENDKNNDNTLILETSYNNGWDYLSINVLETFEYVDQCNVITNMKSPFLNNVVALVECKLNL